MEEENKSKKKNIWAATGTIFVGCMFTGWGIGMLTGHAQIGMFIGIGTGFLVSGIIKLYYS